MKEDNQQSGKPETNIKVGAVRASVWKWQNTTKDGRTFAQRKVVIDRAYKDASGNWKNTNSYDINDLPKAILALQKAYDYMTTTNGHSEVQEETIE